MGEAQDEEGDGWGESIGFGNGEEGEEGLKSGADKEERAEGEVAMKCLLRSVWMMREMDSSELTLKSAVAELKLTPLGRVGDGEMRGLKSILKFGGRIEVYN